MNPHTHLEHGWAPVSLLQLALGLERGLQGIAGGKERGAEGIAPDLEYMSVMSFDRLAQNGVMLGEKPGHFSRKLLRQRRAAFDICKEESDSPGGERRRHLIDKPKTA
jgi:hypothetical protein